MSEVFYFKRKGVDSWAVISGEEALHTYRTDVNWEPISREQFDLEVAQPPFNVDQMTEAAGTEDFAVELTPLHPDDAAALAEPGAPDGICPACGEIDCGQTCYAFLDEQFPPEPDFDGGECPHCRSAYTMRIDTILDDPVVWACECFTCGKSFEMMIPPGAD